MAEKGSAITPRREEHRVARRTPSEWGQGPFTALQRFADEVDRMFNEFGLGLGRGQFGDRLWDAGGGMWAPEIEAFQKGDQFVVRADLPGLSKDDLSINVTDDAVTIQGERKAEHKDEREGYYRSERSYGSFCRVIPLPAGTITDQAKANFRDGVLEITMPAPPASQGRRLEIGEGSRK
jgi:HSP20 family protein